MKRLIAAVVVFYITIFSNAYAYDVTVMVNNEVLETPVPAQIVNDRTVIPMRSVFEKLGADVTWIDSDKMIVATKDDVIIVMQIDNNIMSVQNVKNSEFNVVELDVPPFIRNDYTLLPLRAVSEALSADVIWDEKTYTVNIFVL